MFAGNLGDAQGLDLMIDTAVRMKNTRVKWYLVGDGRAKERLVKKVKENGIEDKVIFVGMVSEAEANMYVHFADCAYLSFSDNKLFDMTMPAKLQTYLACATPILAAVGGESANIISESKCGIVVERKIERVCEGVSKLLDLSPSSIAQMCDNGLKYFNENFTKEKKIDDLEKLIKEKIKMCEEFISL